MTFGFVFWNIFNCLCFIHYTIEFNSELNKICDKGSDLFLKYLPISNQVIDRGGDIFPLFDSDFWQNYYDDYPCLTKNFLLLPGLVEDHYCYAVLYIFDQLHFHLFWWPWSVMAILGITSGFSQRGQNYDFKNVHCMIILRNVFRFITKYFVNCLS